MATELKPYITNLSSQATDQAMKEIRQNPVIPQAICIKKLITTKNINYKQAILNPTS